MYNKLSYNGMDNIRKPIELYKKYVRLQKSLNKRINTNTHIGIYDLFILHSKWIVITWQL